MRILVTGAAGFVGRHLVDYLVRQPDSEVVAVTRSSDYLPASNTRIEPAYADLRQRDQVRRVVEAAKPQGVIHLAAQASVAKSFSDPLETVTNNIVSQVNLLEELLATVPDVRVLIIGSNEEYGRVDASCLPITESAELRPASPYALSKVAQDLMGYQYFATHNMAVVRVRPFNHSGPGQDERFVVASFARQIAEAEAGLRQPIVRVGDLSPRRDFTDARDMARAYSLALTLGEPGEVYNIGSQRAVSIQEILHQLLATSRVPLSVESDPKLRRPTEIPAHVADCSKFVARTGWRPEIPLQQMLLDTLEYWRERTANLWGAS